MTDLLKFSTVIDLDPKRGYTIINSFPEVAITEYELEEGVLSRLNDPAVTFNLPGEEFLGEWWVDGKRHRLDGPAVIYKNGYKEYWINGIQIDDYEFGEAVLNER